MLLRRALVGRAAVGLAGRVGTVGGGTGGASIVRHSADARLQMMMLRSAVAAAPAPAQRWGVRALSTTSATTGSFSAPTHDAEAVDDAEPLAADEEKEREPTEAEVELARKALDILGGTFGDEHNVRRRRTKKAAYMAANEDIKRHELDVGSPEAQITFLTGSIKYLEEHMSTHRKDFAAKRGLHALVAKRHKLFKYLKRKNPERHDEVVRTLGVEPLATLDTFTPRPDTAKKKRKKRRLRGSKPILY